ncbi:GH12 family glycosyl hydrolase domain-containing protein [Catellatospora chokoriensis]|uniref:GH12 family glycosyl hydrolase domain-containing protein n=3 Tax=Catellatospora chokoriensis TaxID=310353 RepID=UPI001784F57E|nr:fibronectin type III domain-containing protein [Catellatospora chokoriensis]
MHATTSRKHRLATVVSAIALTVAATAVSLLAAQPAQAATICEQYGTVVAGNYVIQNNRWGTSATQCINTTSNGFSITQQDGVGNTSGAPVSYPSIFLGCHYSNCSPSSPLPKQLSTIGTAPSSISFSYPGSGTYDAAYDIWLNADTNVSGVQDTEIMIWANRQGSIQPIGSQTGTANIAGRSWAVWTGSNGANNVVSYLFTGSPITSLSFDVMDFVRDTFTRGSQYGNNSWYLTSVQAGFEPWIGGVGLAVNSFSSSVTTGGGTQPPGTPGTPSASNVTTSGASLSWSASSGTVSSYLIERATGASSTSFSQVGTSSSPSFTDSGLAANTTYRYRVRASNSAGTSGYSGIVNVTTTTGGGTQVPGTPGTPSASNVTASGASLSWSASSGTVSSYLIERATGASSTSFSQVGTSSSPSFTDSGLAANTTYRYRVRASNSAGTSGYSGIVNVTTTGGGGGGGCTTTAAVQSQWNNGYVMQVTVTNTGSSTINGWSSTATLPSGHAHTGSWPQAAVVSGQNVTETNQNWNGSLAPGQTASWGFQASRPNGNTALPTAYSCTAS